MTTIHGILSRFTQEAIYGYGQEKNYPQNEAAKGTGQEKKSPSPQENGE